MALVTVLSRCVSFSSRHLLSTAQVVNEPQEPFLLRSRLTTLTGTDE